MRTIVFIGSNQFGTSNEALTVAKEMGYYIVLLTDKQKHDFFAVDKCIYTNHLMDFEKSIDAISMLKEQGHEICACLSFIDPYISYSAKLAKHFNLKEVSIDALIAMENKITFREKLKDLSSSPFFTILHDDEPVDLFIEMHSSSLPLIIKPPALNGSKDIFLVETANQMSNAIHLIQQKHPKHPLLVEEYLVGPQYLIEVLTHNNELNIIGIVAQEFSEDDRFIVIGYQFPALLSEEEHQSLIASVRDITSQLGLLNGSCHLEMRNVNGKWKLIEINPRMSGGVMNRIINEGTGINLIKEIIKLHLGEEPSLNQTKMYHVYARYLTINTRGKLLKVIGKEIALQHENVKDVYIKPLEGRIMTAPFSMGHRYASIIAASTSPEEAKSSALAAAMEIKFYLEPF
ncbi:ATP-grasp domain-containing protein [Bacillus sp. Bva_UNVM-123]|uniref:ATP-grasp domain-containing protein n=1 Tax=Bacillus sp. Bva_UNVM-123 TaxID=2829798 RepID=UPI00391F4921